MRFERIMQFILKWETVYDKHGNVLTEVEPNDPGGATKYGVDQRAHPNVDVRKLTLDGAMEIYRGEWNLWDCDSKPYPLGEVYFNCCVNCGRSRAQKIMALIDDSDSYKAAVAFLNEQEGFYRRLVESKPKLEEFLKGWLNRTKDLKRFISQ